MFAEQAIGVSVDEFHRAKDSGVTYLKNVFPLLDLNWSRQDCLAYLRDRGWGDTPRSACLGCPFHGNREWRRLRQSSPAEWADVVEFDRAIRHGHPHASAEGTRLRGQYYVHHSRQPLESADLTPASRRRAPRDADDGADPDGCSPWGCRSGPAITGPLRQPATAAAARRAA